jgi:hypothetical protein
MRVSASAAAQHCSLTHYAAQKVLRHSTAGLRGGQELDSTAAAAPAACFVLQAVCSPDQTPLLIKSASAAAPRLPFLQHAGLYVPQQPEVGSWGSNA